MSRRSSKNPIATKIAPPPKIPRSLWSGIKKRKLVTRIATKMGIPPPLGMGFVCNVAGCCLF